MCLVLAAAAGLRVPVIVAEHNDPAQQPLARPWRLLRRGLYRRASRVIVLMKTAAAYFSPAVRRHTRLIPNPVVVTRWMLMGPCHRRTAAMGGHLLRLGGSWSRKGLICLLQAFATIAPRHPEWSLINLGRRPFAD